MLIDQLASIAHKTRGNLTPDEEAVLNSALSNLQVAFVEASKAAKSAAFSGQPTPTQSEA